MKKDILAASAVIMAIGLGVTAGPATAQAPGPGRAPSTPGLSCGLSHFCGVPYKYVAPAKPPSPTSGRNWRSGDGVKLINGVATGVGGTNGWGSVCFGSPICGWRSGANTVHVVHKPNMGYTYAYPLQFPAGQDGGVTGVAVNSKGHIIALVRNDPGNAQLFEWDENLKKFVRAFGVDLTGKSHGMAIDAQDNIWVCDQFGDTVIKLSPEGKILMILGVKGKRGDWDEAKGQRLLWQPLDLAFAKNGDVYIGMGHANESPNDGAARILHLDKDGKFINQWFGNANGPGKFSMAHGIAVDAKNNVYIADREEYRIVVYDGNGKFVKTLQEPNLICTLYVDPHDQLWAATGQDGQVIKLDKNGNIVGAAGVGPGKGDGQFSESSKIVMDAHGNLFVGDTSNTRVTELVARK